MAHRAAWPPGTDQQEGTRPTRRTAKQTREGDGLMQPRTRAEEGQEVRQGPTGAEHPGGDSEFGLVDQGPGGVVQKVPLMPRELPRAPPKAACQTGALGGPCGVRGEAVVVLVMVVRWAGAVVVVVALELVEWWRWWWRR